MAINQSNTPVLKQITSGRAYMDNLASKYILKPLGAQGINGFVFDYEGETSVTLNSDITDHFTEENVAIQDHIALRPARLVLRGFVAELAYNRPGGVEGAVKALADRLGAVSAYLPQYTPGMLAGIQKAASQAQSAVNKIDSTINRLGSMASLFSATGDTKQKQAYQTLKSMWATKQIFTVETPYEYFETMAIETLTFIQPEDTKFVSDIVVTLKQIRTAEVEYTKFDNTLYAGRANEQKQPEADKGKTAGTQKTTSSLFDLFHPGGQ